MKQYKRAELALIFFGGALLILHAIAVCVRMVTGISTEQVISTYSLANRIGQVAAILCFFGVGLSLIGLAWEKHRSASLGAGSGA